MFLKGCNGDMTNRIANPNCGCESTFYNEEVDSVNTCLKCPKKYTTCSSATSGDDCQGTNRKAITD